MGFVLSAAAIGHAGPSTAESKPAGLEPADAAIHDLSHSLLNRLEFENLGLQLIGVASFGGQSSCFIKLPGIPVPQTFDRNDQVGGYRIVEINGNGVMFEREGERFVLAVGGDNDESSTGEEARAARAGAETSLEPDPDLDPAASIQQEINELTGAVVQESKEPDRPITIKSARDDLKSRTARFEVARVVKDGWNVATGGSISRQVASNVRFAPPIPGRQTSGFGYRQHPMGGGWRMHSGVDLAAPYGTTVRAAAAGVVTRVGYNSSLGRYVYLRHENGYETRYGHLSAQLVKTGQSVGQGDPIGREGSTGLSTGPHLHFEVRKDGRALNPMYYLGR